MCVCVCVCVCARARARACVWWARNTILCLSFYAYIFVDLVKRGMLTIVGEIRRCRNDRFCHHYYSPSLPFVSFGLVCMSLIYTSLQFFLSPCVFVAFLQLYPFCYLSFAPRLIVKAEEDTA